MRPAPTPFTRAQRDGRACVACEGEDGELTDAGYVDLPDLPGHGWAVVEHPSCPTAPKEDP